MKNLKLIIVLSILIVSSAIAQDISWGTLTEKPSKKMVFDRIIGQDNSSIYVMGSQRKFFSKADPYIFCFDKDAKNIKFSKPLKLPQDAKGKEQQLEDIILLKDNSIVFTSYFDKDAQTYYAYAGILDRTNGSISGNMKEVDNINVSKIKSGISFFGRRGRESTNFDFEASNDGTKILIYHNEPFDKYNNEKFSFKVVDSKLNVIWSKAVELPYKDKEVRITNYTLDNDGNVYMLAKVGELNDTKKKKDEDAKFKYIIVAYNYKDNSIKEYEVSLPGKLITDITFKINQKGNLVCGGYYSDKNINSLGGVFFMSIDKQTKKALKSGSKDFDDGFMARLIGERRAKNGKEVANMDMNQFILRDDGGALLVGEQNYIITRCTTDPKTGQQHCTTTYYYMDIIVTSFNPDGSVQCNQVIKKHQAARSPYYLSYIEGSANGKLHLLFNDNIKNLELRKTTDKVRSSNATKKSHMVVDAIINPNGTVDYKKVFDYKTQKILLSPNVYKQVNKNQLILLGEWKKKFNFGTMTMN